MHFCPFPLISLVGGASDNEEGGALVCPFPCGSVFRSCGCDRERDKDARRSSIAGGGGLIGTGMAIRFRRRLLSATETIISGGPCAKPRIKGDGYAKGRVLGAQSQWMGRPSQLLSCKAYFNAQSLLGAQGPSFAHKFMTVCFCMSNSPR